MRNEQQEEKDRKKGMIWTISVHAVLLALCIFPFLGLSKAKIKELKDKTPKKYVTIDFGANSKNNDRASAKKLTKAGKKRPNPAPPKPAAKTNPTPAKAKPTPPKPTPKPKPTVKPTPSKKVVTAPDPKAVALEAEKKRREAELAHKQQLKEARETREKEEKERKELEEEERKAREEEARQAKAAADAVAAALEAAAAKAAAEAAASGDGDGDEDSGNEGSDSEDREGMADEGDEGTGKGLTGRRAIRRPDMRKKSSKSGKIKVEICVNQSGQVQTVEVKSKGSTTNDDDLYRLAEKYAWEYEYEENYNAPEVQCGFVTFVFRQE